MAAARPRRGARAQVCEICLALPGVAVIDEGDHATFRVGGRVFAYFLDDHHGDGIVSVCVKSALGENLDRARLEPDRYYLPAYIGSRGWFGMRLDRPRTDWREAAAIVVRSYRLVAPKRSLRQLDGA